MKNYQKTWIALSTTFILSLGACSSSDRTTGNEEAAHEGNAAMSDTNANAGSNRPDTTVTGVPGNTNAVNAEGNAGNGSGMGSKSSTEAQQH